MWTTISQKIVKRALKARASLPQSASVSECGVPIDLEALSPSRKRSGWYSG
jgi:hypothetical protein